MKRKSICFILCFVVLAVSFSFSSASKLSKARNKKNSIDNRIEEINSQKRKEERKLHSAVGEKKELLSRQHSVNSEYNKLVSEVNRIKKQIKDVAKDVDEAEENYRQQEELFKTRVRVMYENSSNSYLELLIESKSFSEFFARMKYMSMISGHDKEMMSNLERAKKDVEYKKRFLEEKKFDVQKTADSKLLKINKLKVSRADIESQIRELNDKLDILEKQEDELIKQSEEMAALIKSLTRKKGKYTGGSMVWPCPSSNEISSYYGIRVHPILKVKKKHTGIDISASSGVSIVAANKGTVIVAGWQSGYGNTVVVDHGGGITTLYAHTSRILVDVGQEVGAGDVIAKVGSTGLSTGPHLHFEVRVNGATTNPMRYFGG